YGRNGAHLHAKALHSMWVRLRKKIGLEDVRIHDLRHSAASDALNAGVPLAVVGAILGHKSPQTTARYAHVASNVARDATDRMTAGMARIVRGVEGK
ncbi:MAG: tyrosine-type recombinase/integrase, partial [Nannocystaceae bacterium]